MKNYTPYAWALLLLAIPFSIGLSLESQPGPASRTTSAAVAGAGSSVLLGGDTIQSQDNGSPRTLRLNPDGGDVKMGAYGVHGPLAYGRVASTGSPVSFSSNITATHRHAVGEYDIHIAGGALPGDVVIVTPSDFFATPQVYIEDGAYHVRMIWFTTDEITNAGFSFVIYRP